MKGIKSVISVILSVIILISAGLPAAYCYEAEDDTSTSAAFDSSDFLTAKGRYLFNSRGERIILRGVNLGAWLVFEDWLCPYEEVSDNFEVIDTLENRFGTEKAYELLNTYYDNTITGYDFDNIKSMGFNCVRIPFWFRNFYYDDNGTKSKSL